MVNLLAQKRDRRSIYLAVYVVVAGISVLLLTNTVAHTSFTSVTPDVDASSNGTKPVENYEVEYVCDDLSTSDLKVNRSEYTRGTEMRRLLSNADTACVLELLSDTNSISEDNKRLALLYEIFRKLTVLDPELGLSELAKFSWKERERLIEAVFREWAFLDIETAANRAIGLSHSDKRVALQTIMDVRDDLDFTSHLEIASTLGLESIAYDIWEQSVVAGADLNPKKSLQTLLEDDRNDVAQIGSLVSILQLWIHKEGLDAINSAKQLMHSHRISMAVIGNSLSKVAAINPKETFEFVLELEDIPNHRRQAFLVGVMQPWARIDPTEALRVVSQLDDDSLRRRLQNSVAHTWASRDPQAVLKGNLSLPADLGRVARNTAIMYLAMQSPREAVQVMSSFVPNNEVARSVVFSWSEHDPDEALDWVLSEPTLKNIRNELISTVLAHLVIRDPNEALQIALQQPIEGWNEGLEVGVIETLAELDVDHAIGMLSRVRGGSTKSAASNAVGAELVRRNRFDRAIELGEELAKPMKQVYFRNMVAVWAYHDPPSLLESLDTLPTEDIKSYAIAWLKTANEDLLALSDEDVLSLQEVGTHTHER